ncbi:MSC_0882 family membrane protein [Mycoplasmopsis cricetuli]|uniref:MSC_0882 family membrane protein n=1 Tax=Mycoplasmopsis cricetuli TaxID=171283 RepID=UPI00046E9135|nr:hypothetical protein [Mycoplasmopsis cricetuli]
MFKPKVSNNTIEIQQSSIVQNSIDLNQKTNNKFIDPQNIISPESYKILKKEKQIRKIGIIFWCIVLLLTIVGSIVNWFLNFNAYGWWVFIGMFFLVSVFLLVKNWIKLIAWKKIEIRYRESFALGDLAASTTFAELCKSLIHKSVSFLWIYIFIFTYYGLFNLIVFGLYKWNTIEIKTPETSSLKLNFEFNIREALENTFGNVKILLIVGISILFVITILFIVIRLYDKKRIEDAKLFIINDSGVVFSTIEESKRKLNKAWRNFYFIIFTLTILLPLALIIYLVSRKILKFRKK